MIYTEFDELQEALKNVNLDEEVMPICKGRLVENADAYCKIQKLLNAPEMLQAHRYLYDLDVDNLQEKELGIVEQLYDLALKRGVIQADPAPEAVTAPVEPEIRISEPTAIQTMPVSEPPKQKVQIPCWTILYSATDSFGNMKCGECYSNSINVQSAKADALAKLSRFGYDNVAILAIEAGDPDMAGCEEVACCEAEKKETSAEEQKPTEEEKKEVKEDDLLDNRPHNAHMAESEEQVKESEEKVSEDDMLDGRVHNLHVEESEDKTSEESTDKKIEEDLGDTETLEAETTEEQKTEAEKCPECGNDPCTCEAEQIAEAKGWKVAWFDNEDSGVAEFKTEKEALDWIKSKETEERYNPTGFYCDDPINEAEDALESCCEDDICPACGHNPCTCEADIAGDEDGVADEIIEAIEELDESGNPYLAGMKVTTDNGAKAVTTPKTTTKKTEKNAEKKETSSEETKKEEKSKEDNKKIEEKDDSKKEESKEEKTENTTKEESKEDSASTKETKSEESSEEKSEDAESTEDASEDTEKSNTEETSAEEKNDSESTEEKSEEEPVEDKTDSDLTDEQKAELKDEYKRVFKATMLKCKFEKLSFNDLSIEQKVTFFEELNKAWTKNEPQDFMTDKETDQLEAIVIKK